MITIDFRKATEAMKRLQQGVIMKAKTQTQQESMANMNWTRSRWPLSSQLGGGGREKEKTPAASDEELEDRIVLQQGAEQRGAVLDQGPKPMEQRQRVLSALEIAATGLQILQEPLGLIGGGVGAGLPERWRQQAVARSFRQLGQNEELGGRRERQTSKKARRLGTDPFARIILKERIRPLGIYQYNLRATLG
jgi:hypothetical protein